MSINAKLALIAFLFVPVMGIYGFYKARKMYASRYEIILEKSLYKAYNELLRFPGIRQGVAVLQTISVDVNLPEENGFVF